MQSTDYSENTDLTPVEKKGELKNAFLNAARYFLCLGNKYLAEGTNNLVWRVSTLILETLHKIIYDFAIISSTYNITA